MKAVFTSVRFVSSVNLLDKSNIAVQGWCFSVRGVLGICDISATNNIHNATNCSFVEHCLCITRVQWHIYSSSLAIVANVDLHYTIHTRWKPNKSSQINNIKV